MNLNFSPSIIIMRVKGSLYYGSSICNNPIFSNLTGTGYNYSGSGPISFGINNVTSRSFDWYANYVSGTPNVTWYAFE